MALLGAVAVLPGCGIFQPALPVVDSVDLTRYAGKWYEIARYPNSFERNCTGVTADYTLRDDGRVTVLNTCFERSLDGRERTIEGTARAADDTGAKLKVTFFWPFEADYWILELGDNYEYAVVGEPGRQFLWILSRTPTMDEAVYNGILERLPALNYQPARLERVVQAEEAPDPA
jgi:apolipoprotein D and lipocalin family protein